DAATGAKSPLPGPRRGTGPYSTAAFNADGQRLAVVTRSLEGQPGETAPGQPSVTVYDLAAEKLVVTFPVATEQVNELCFRPNDKQLALACEDSTVRLHDAATGESLRVLRGHTTEVAGVAFSPGGRRLASRGKDGTVKLWDPDQEQEVRVLAGHGSCSFSPDGARLVTTRFFVGQYPVLYDVAEGREVTGFWPVTAPSAGAAA